jgi:hypothetical protein
MYPLRMVRQALGLALLVTLLVLAMSACGGGGSQEEQANNPRHLPQNNATLRRRLRGVLGQGAEGSGQREVGWLLGAPSPYSPNY